MLMVLIFNTFVALCWHKFRRDDKIIAVFISCCPLVGLLIYLIYRLYIKRCVRIENNIVSFKWAELEQEVVVPDVAKSLDLMSLSDIEKVDSTIGFLTYKVAFESNEVVGNSRSHYINGIKTELLRFFQDKYKSLKAKEDTLAFLKRMVDSGVYSKGEMELYRGRFCELVGNDYRKLEPDALVFYIDCLLYFNKLDEVRDVYNSSPVTEAVCLVMLKYAYLVHDIELIKELVKKLDAFKLSVEGQAIKDYWRGRV